MKDKILEKFSRKDKRGQTLLTPFVVSKEYKTLYLHIAKTGGSTITKILRDNSLDDMVLTDKNASYEKKYAYFKDVVEHWKDYLKFTFIRNKFDQLVSHWHYDGHPGSTFDRFIKAIVIPNEDIYDFWIDQYYLTIIDRKSIFNFVGFYENFNEDLKCIMGNLKQVLSIKDYDTNMRMNAGHYDRSIPYREYYNKETKAAVYTKFKEEIDYYNME